MPRAERIVRHQASPLQHLPSDKARYAEHEIGGPLDQRQRNRLLRRNAERRAQQHQTAFLRAERAGDGERRPANGMQETLVANSRETLNLVSGRRLRRGGRVAEGTGLLNRHRSKACRGFKSRPLRHTSLKS